MDGANGTELILIFVANRQELYKLCDQVILMDKTISEIVDADERAVSTTEDSPQPKNKKKSKVNTKAKMDRAKMDKAKMAAQEIFKITSGKHIMLGGYRLSASTFSSWVEYKSMSLTNNLGLTCLLENRCSVLVTSPRLFFYFCSSRLSEEVMKHNFESMCLHYATIAPQL